MVEIASEVPERLGCWLLPRADGSARALCALDAEASPPKEPSGAPAVPALPITAPVDLSERDNKEALIVKKGVETNDAGVSEEVVVKVAREL